VPAYVTSQISPQRVRTSAVRLGAPLVRKAAWMLTMCLLSSPPEWPRTGAIFLPVRLVPAPRRPARQTEAFRIHARRDSRGHRLAMHLPELKAE